MWQTLVKNTLLYIIVVSCSIISREETHHNMHALVMYLPSIKREDYICFRPPLLEPIYCLVGNVCLISLQ